MQQLPELKKELLVILQNYIDGRDQYLGEKLKKTSQSLRNFFKPTKLEKKAPAIGINDEANSIISTASLGKGSTPSDSAKYSLGLVAELKDFFERISDYHSLMIAHIKMLDLYTENNMEKSPNLMACLATLAIKLKPWGGIGYSDTCEYKFGISIDNINQIQEWNPNNWLISLDQSTGRLFYGRFDKNSGWHTFELSSRLSERNIRDLFLPQEVNVEMCQKQIHFHYSNLYTEFDYSGSIKAARLAINKQTLSDEIRSEIEMFSRHYLKKILGRNGDPLVLLNARLDEYSQLKKSSSEKNDPLLSNRHDGSFWQPQNLLMQGMKQQIMLHATASGVKNIDTLLDQPYSFYQKVNLLSGGKYLEALSQRLEEIYPADHQVVDSRSSAEFKV